MASGTSSPRAGSTAHFTYGSGSFAASVAKRNGSKGRIDRACCPAVMTIGVRLRYAVKMLPIAWPMPAAECRLTSAALPVACA